MFRSPPTLVRLVLLWAERASVWWAGTPLTAPAASLPQRPLALSVVSQMKEPTFATFMYQLPCGRQTAFFSSSGQEYTVVFWDGKEESR